MSTKRTNKVCVRSDNVISINRLLTWHNPRRGSMVFICIPLVTSSLFLQELMVHLHTLVPEVFLDFPSSREAKTTRIRLVFTTSGLSHSPLMRRKILENLWDQGKVYTSWGYTPGGPNRWKSIIGRQTILLYIVLTISILIGQEPPAYSEDSRDSVDKHDYCIICYAIIRADYTVRSAHCAPLAKERGHLNGFEWWSCLVCLSLYF